jgi:hypothetical protein
LLAAVLAERQARGGKKRPVSDETTRKQRIKEVAPPLAMPSGMWLEFGVARSPVT